MKIDMEYFGEVIRLEFNEDFGFIKSHIDNNRYYFNKNWCKARVNYGDQVIFSLIEEQDKQQAIYIRKIYINGDGVRFIPNTKFAQLHIDIDHFIPLLMDEIETPKSRDVQIREFYFEKIIGKTIIVPTSSNDKILYAIRKNRFGHSRFVLGREPKDTQYITLILKPKDRNWIVLSAYLGQKATQEPWNKSATIKDFAFWNNNAFIYDKEIIIENSHSYTCPWVLNCHTISYLNTVHPVILELKKTNT